MDTQVQLSPKQVEYIANAKSRWNFKIGATQCGKTFIDVQYVIPSRITERIGLKGLNVILGVSKETIERNVLEPMRDIWGEKLVSHINSRNFATLFGEKVYCLGAEKVTQVSKLRGAKFKYCYVDEIVDIHPEVFQLLKSRLSLPYSCCDASGNPSFPAHFVKKFIDSGENGVDIYCQRWTLYDNPFLDPSYVKALEAEYRGTVFFNRYINGEWTQAEGLIYPMFPVAREEPSDGPWKEYALSIDYGTQNAFAGLLWASDGKVWHAIREYHYSGRDTGRQKTDEDYVQDMEAFIDGLPDSVFLGGGLLTIVDPSATSFIAALQRRTRTLYNPVRRRDTEISTFRIRHANNDVQRGIRDTAVCIQKGVIKISKVCVETFKEFEGYVWDDSAEDRPVKVNDHHMDALRYFVETKRLTKPTVEYKSKFGG